VETVLAIFLKINCPNFKISADWYGAAIPNFRLVWRPPYLPYRRHCLFVCVQCVYCSLSMGLSLKQRTLKETRTHLDLQPNKVMKTRNNPGCRRPLREKVPRWILLCTVLGK